MSSSKPERGASAIIVTASMLLIMGIAAVAVDLAAGWNERRQDQTAADLGATSGALNYIAPASGSDVADQVLATVRVNLDTEYTNAEWEALWSACTDPQMPSDFAAMGAPSSWTATTLPCISGSRTELRVRVPDQIIETNFAGAIGANELTTQAVAHSTFVYRSGGNPKPWGLVDGLAAGERCLSTPGSGLAAPPCDGADTGNFGTLLIPTWGSDETIVDCGTPGADELSINIALGVDHFIGVAPSITGSGGAWQALVDSQSRRDECTDVGGVAEPADNVPMNMVLNAIESDTGSSSTDAVFNGLITGFDGFANATGAVTPLLQQVQSAGFAEMTGSTSERIVAQRLPSIGQEDYTVDNTPLYEHMRDIGDLSANSGGYVGLSGGLQAACNKSTIEGINAGGGDWTAALTACLSAWETERLSVPNLQPLFGDSLDDNPRFGWAPQFHFTTWGTGKKFQPIKTYRMIYINRLFFNCNGSYNSPNNDQPCDGGVEGRGGLIFVPEGHYDESLVKKGNGGSMKKLRLDQVTAFLIPVGSAPRDIETAYPGSVTGPFEIQISR